MKTKVFGIVFIGYLGMMLVLSSVGAQSHTEPDCSFGRWLFLTDTERRACIDRAGGVVGVSATYDAMILATTLARPTTAPWSGLATEEALYEATGRPTVVPTLPPGVIPDAYTKIKPFEREGGSPVVISYRYFASIWHVGAVLSEKGKPLVFVVKTYRKMCGISTDTISGPNYIDKAFHKSWKCPHDWGMMNITGATGPTGIVSFTNALSQTGTFNLTTHEWSFDE